MAGDSCSGSPIKMKICATSIARARTQNRIRPVAQMDNQERRCPGKRIKERKGNEEYGKMVEMLKAEGHASYQRHDIKCQYYGRKTVSRKSMTENSHSPVDGFCLNDLRAELEALGIETELSRIVDNCAIDLKRCRSKAMLVDESMVSGRMVHQFRVSWLSRNSWHSPWVENSQGSWSTLRPFPVDHTTTTTTVTTGTTTTATTIAIAIAITVSSRL
ncbi:hypothetical protein V1478_001565 [Vespula squamosa]|uniref:Uncharacterized protein n=1 Tax=Vespula squamosa TaxID=30214 RepID=A0ABD2C1T7_VESSQ